MKAMSIKETLARILNSVTITTGTCGVYTATASVDALTNRLIRIGNVVHIDLVLHFTNENIPPGNFATIPNGFKPSDSVNVPMVWRNASGTVIPYRASIAPTGYIAQQVGSNTAYVLVSGTYKI